MNVTIVRFMLIHVAAVHSFYCFPVFHCMSIQQFIHSPVGGHFIEELRAGADMGRFVF